VASIVGGGEGAVAEELCMVMDDDADALFVGDAKQRLLEPVRHLTYALVLGRRAASDFSLERGW
jgi:hypothetical protein